MRPDDMSPEQAEAAFVRWVRRHGTPSPDARVLRLQPHLDDSGETDCWTHAWRLAEETGARYVEGLCHRGNGKVSTHAWVEEDSPFGPRVVETTIGYEHAYGYSGVTVSRENPLARRAHFDGLRFSVIQLALAVGQNPGKAIR